MHFMCVMSCNLNIHNYLTRFQIRLRLRERKPRSQVHRVCKGLLSSQRTDWAQVKCCSGFSLSDWVEAIHGNSSEGGGAGLLDGEEKVLCRIQTDFLHLNLASDTQQLCDLKHLLNLTVLQLLTCDKQGSNYTYEIVVRIKPTAVGECFQECLMGSSRLWMAATSLLSLFCRNPEICFEDISAMQYEIFSTFFQQRSKAGERTMIYLDEPSWLFIAASL